ncbi:hypothetical protein [Methylotenera mobilis]|uniref:Uncharacterized protein n=1 Tax=Methylotenera mobilis (strain JLW8 / ATCC BAA-1282 / DSM 17540) TaxID=583345 RepID=C6WWS1_METML|nr:hypothetical protein [Methylotenera mobilis]ACT48370.1 hypothetical protein Mmol_1466 [Methylotenera mobilis JLW8]
MAIKSIGVVSPSYLVYKSMVIQELQTIEGDAYYFCESIDGCGGVSTKIVEWYPQNKIGKTESGRIYQLIDEPGDPKNSELQIIKRALIIKYLPITHRDVTFEFTKKKTLVQQQAN